MRIWGQGAFHPLFLAHLDLGDSLLAVGYCIGHILSVNDVLALEL